MLFDGLDRAGRDIPDQREALLAYSSVAQIGYMVLGISFGNGRRD